MFSKIPLSEPPISHQSLPANSGLESLDALCSGQGRGKEVGLPQAA